MRSFCGSVWIVFLLMAGCSSMVITPEEQVRQRAQERIDFLLAGDLTKSMEYTTPAYRQASTRGRYGARFAGAANWTSAAVESVVCEAERCEVSVLISYQLPRPRIMNTRSLEEVWIKVDGQWYIYL